MSTTKTNVTPEVISTLDVREILHSQRHPVTHRTFDGLKPGQAFILVVDHDPKPVLYELDFLRNGKYSWNYLEQGPEVWRVQVAKIR